MNVFLNVLNTFMESKISVRQFVISLSNIFGLLLYPISLFHPDILAESSAFLYHIYLD